MLEPLLELSSHTRGRLSKALEAGLVDSPYTATAVKSAVGVTIGDPAIEALESLDAADVPAPAIAMMLTAADKALAQRQAPDFVWSGPEVHGLHARDTRAVYEELLGGATRSIWASTYAFFDGPKAFGVLAERMDAIESLRVVLLLNIQRKWGDTTEAAELVSEFSNRFWESEWPGQRKPEVYFDPRSLQLEAPKSVLHAKGVVVDEEAVFLTSANFTEAALDRNIEMGLLTRDRTLALTVVAHFTGLVERGLLEALP